MDYRLAIDSATSKKAEGSVSVKDNNEGNKEMGLTSVKEGQLVTATVVSVDDQITLDFNGQKVTTPPNILNHAVAGDTKTFEVVKVADHVVELRLIDDTTGRQKSFTSVRIKADDFDAILSRQEQAAKRAGQETKYRETRDKLEQVSSKLTELDCRILEEEGFSVEDYTIEGLYEAVDRVKQKAEGATQKLTEKSNSYDKETLSKRLKEENLPVTEDNLTKLSNALTLSGLVSKIDDKAMQCLISTEAVPSAQNIYKARYSISIKSRDNTEKLSSNAWDELENQVKEVIKSAGYEVNASNLADAKWLIENKLPLTEATLSYKKNLEELKSSKNSDETLDRMLQGMKKGIHPKDVSLMKEDSAWAGQVIAEIKSISEEAITHAVKDDDKMTLRKLVSIQQNLSPTTSSQNEDKTAIFINKTAKEILKSASDLVTQLAGQNETNVDQELVSSITELTNDIAKIASTIAQEADKTDRISNKIAQEASDIIGKAKLVTKQVIEIKGGQEAGTGTKSSLEASQMVDDISQKISDIAKAAEKLIDITQSDSKPLTKQSLVSIAEADDQVPIEENEIGDIESADIDTKDYLYEELKARRQLEEIRLKMTLEAAGNLEKKGITVETEELSKVVEELRKIEDNYYRKQLKEADADTSDLSIQTLKETTQSIDQLKALPCSVLGRTLSIRSTQTISGLLEEGSKLQSDYTKAGIAYETLATVPNSEYGDSIKKAFANADTLLKQLGIDNTEQNKRAIRILGYNQMEITEDSINQVKAYDKQVTTLIQNLHPAVTVRMIKEGMNPLDQPIYELNHTIDQMKEEQGISSEDKFSTYLRNLEKQNGITTEERKAYIGIYRLLYNVDKSDGAVLGAVMKADKEVTLGNLLTAVQTDKKGRLDTVINDEFGTLQNISYEKETIAGQLSSFTEGNRSGDKRHRAITGTDGQIPSLSGEQTLPNMIQSDEHTEYMGRIVKQLMEELTPEKLMKSAEAISQEASKEQMASVISEETGSHGIWESMKGTSIEKLLENIQGTEELQAADEEVYAAKVQELRELSKNSEQSIRFLNDYRMPSSSMNIQMANSILSYGESPIKKLLKLNHENKVENSKNALKEMNDLSDKLIDKSSMQEAYEQLEADAKDSMSRVCAEEVIDSRRLAELKSISRQMTFMGVLADKEFYQIPIETESGITNLNLTILRGTNTAGKVSVHTMSKPLGNIKAEFSLKDQELKGFVSSDNRSGLELLQKNTGEIERAAQENNVKLGQIDFGVQHRENDSYIYQNPGREAGSATVTQDTERILYRIAKAVVETIRMAQSSESITDRAVS